MPSCRNKPRISNTGDSDDSSESDERDNNTQHQLSSADDSDCSEIEDGDISEWESDWETEEEDENVTMQESLQNPGSSKPSTSTSGESCRISQVVDTNLIDSDDSEAECMKCPICLASFGRQEVATPQSCEHYFCAKCLMEWAKHVNTCPVDRIKFNLILLRDCINGPIKQEILCEPINKLSDSDEGPTYCLVCHQCDREDTLLLCDLCNEGYHLECLTPPLLFVPTGDWLCPRCTTLQVTDGSNRTSQGRRNQVNSRRRRRTRRRQRVGTRVASVSVTTSLQSDSRSRKQKKRRRRRKKSRVKNILVPVPTTRGRLAEKLGIGAQKNHDILPANINRQRNYAGIPTLHLFGRPDDLEYFSSGSEGGERSDSVGGLSVMTQPRPIDSISARRLAAMKTILRSENSSATRRRRPVEVSSHIDVSNADILGTIMESQSLWHSKNSVVTINRDGSVDIRKKSERSSSSSGVGSSHSDSHSPTLLRPDTRLHEISGLGTPVNVNNPTSSSVSTAPLYPGGGNNSAPSSSGAQTPGTTQFSTSPSYQNNPGYSRTTGTSYDATRANREYSNYLNNESSSSTTAAANPVRFRLMQKLPTKRSQSSKNSENTSRGRDEDQANKTEEPLHSEHNLETKDEISRNKTSKDTEDEDLDIYSDIEVDGGSGGNGASEHDDVERTYDTLLPPPEPSALLMGLGEQDSSDGDTSDSLVIDFTPPHEDRNASFKTDAGKKSPVSESDKYDPAVPCVDTEDEQSSLEIALNTSTEEEIPLPPCPPPANSNLADNNIAGNYLHSPTYDDISKHCSTNEGVLNQVVFQNQLVGLSITKSAVSSSQTYIVDEEDDDEGECPNFSIYSATSMDIARKTAEEQEDNDESVKVCDEGKTTQIQTDETSRNKFTIKEKNEKSNVDILSVKPENAEFILLDREDCSVERSSACDNPKKNNEESDLEQQECEIKLDRDTDSYKKLRNIGEHTKIEDNDVKSRSSSVQDSNRNSAAEFKLSRDENKVCSSTIVHSNQSINEENGDSERKSTLVEEIFGSDDNDSLIGGATSAVSAATLDNNLPSSTPLGLEGLDTETISETEEAINFDDLSQDGTEFLTEEDGEICSTKKRKKRIGKGSVNLGKDVEKLVEIDGFIPPDSIDYEEGEIVDDRPKLTELTKKEKRSDKKDKRHEKETLKHSDENADITKPKTLNDEEKRKKKKKSLDKERIVLESSENKEKSKDKVSKLDETSISWKKLSKGTKDRNYRDGKLSKANEKETSKKGTDSKDIGTKKEKKKKEKRKDMERYDVRKIVGDKKRKRRDEFGRDLSRDRSYSKSRSRSRGRSRDRSRSRSRSKLNRSKARSPLRSRLRSRSRSYRSRSRSKNRTKRKSKERGRKSRSRERTRKPSRDRSRSRVKRSRSRSRSRSRNRSRSRSLLRSRERKDRVRTTTRSSQRNLSRRSWSHSWTPSWSRSRSISCSSYSRSCTPSIRHFNRSYSPSFSRSWSREHNERLPVAEKKSVPLVKTAKKLTVIVNNTKEDGDRLKKKDKKKKEQKKLKDGITILEKRKKRKEKSPAPSKEVFTSGDNILVSVNFNKSNKLSKDATIPAVTTTVPSYTRETTKRKQREEGFEIERDQSKKLRKDKTVKEKSQGAKSNSTVNEKLSKSEKKSKKAKEDKRIAALLKQKPVAIIDLDQSPFREQTPSPTDLIVLSDSDEEIRNKENENTVDILTGRRLMRPSSNSPQSSSKLSHMMPKISSSRTPESESPLRSAISNYLVTSTGPKTPPEPQIKFSVATKPQLRSISNPLREDDDDMLAEDNCLDDSDQRIEEELNRNIGDIIHKGPNTPPEPRGPTTPRSPPTSPDAYDPFDPTKSVTPSPVRQEISLDGMESPNGTPCEEIHQHNIGGRNSPMASDSEELLKSVEMNSKNPLLQSCEDITEVSDFPHSPDHSCLSRVDSTLGKSPSGLAESTVTSSQLQHDIELSPSIESSEILEKNKHKPVTSSGTLLVTSSSDISKLSPDRKMMTIASQQSKLQMNSQKQHIKSIPTSQQPVTSTPTCQILYSNVSNLSGVQCSPITSAPSSRTNLFNAAPILSVSHHHQHHLPSPPVINQQRVLNVKVTTEKVSSSLTKVTCRSSMMQNGEQKQVCQDTTTDIVDMDLDSPYSPGSSEGDDLFEPPPETVKASLGIRSSQQTQKNSKHNIPPTSTTHKSPSKNQDKFDSIFCLSPQRTKSTAKATRTNTKGHTKSAKTKGKHGKGGKKEITIKMDEDQLQILDELPSSAVELQVKDKFLKKLNRQERVVEEVKLSLKPYYTKKYINKEEYKEILRRSVPKICHNRSGEINPIKISTLVDAYVKKYRYVKKKSSVGTSKPKIAKTTMWS